MKKIFSSPIVGEIPRLRGMLEGAGITCVLRNEISSGLSAAIPLAESMPELWIEDDLRLAEALQIKADFQSSRTAVEKDWQCSKCGEISEPQFSSCWNCGAIREIQNPPEWIKPEPAQTMPVPEAPEEEEPVQEEESGMPCVACEKQIPVSSKYCPLCGWTQPYDTTA